MAVEVTRPVPLEFSYAETPLAQTLESLLEGGKGPVYVVHFTQAEAAESAQDFTSIAFARARKRAPSRRPWKAPDSTARMGPRLSDGCGTASACITPGFCRSIACSSSNLAQQGLLKVICGTDTLGVGINVPIRTVLFTQLCKFDAAEDRHPERARLSPNQRTRRPQRFDDVGWVVAQAPAHAIENLQLEAEEGRGREEVRQAQAAGTELRQLGQANISPA